MYGNTFRKVIECENGNKCWSWKRKSKAKSQIKEVILAKKLQQMLEMKTDKECGKNNESQVCYREKMRQVKEKE